MNYYVSNIFQTDFIRRGFLFDSDRHAYFIVLFWKKSMWSKTSWMTNFYTDEMQWSPLIPIDFDVGLWHDQTKMFNWMVLYTILPINHLLRQTYVQVSFVITSIKIRYAGYVFPNTTTTLIGVLLFQIIDLQLHKVL